MSSLTKLLYRLGLSTMQTVLIIAENSLQQERLCVALKFDRTVQIMTANIRQINPKNLKAFKQADLIVLEDTSDQGDPRTTEFLLSSLKSTGLPIVLLPSMQDDAVGDREPLVLNLTEQTIAQPGLAALIKKIRDQYVGSSADHVPSSFLPLTPLAAEPLAATPAESFLSESVESQLAASEPTHSQSPSNNSSKVTYALTSMGRITKQLRGPLSNMNLAIHMLGKVQSIEERDRYVKLLREEYQRELQLVNELETLQDSILTNL